MAKKAERRVYWRPLVTGDIVDVVAPAWACPTNELDDAVRFLRGHGLIPRFTPEFLDKDFCYSQTAEFRFKDFKRALLAPDSKAIWCVRGGSGSMMLVPELKKLKRPAHVKLLAGLSDITTLHIFLNQKWGWPTLHAPVLSRMGSERAPEAERVEVLNVLFGHETHVTFSDLEPMNAAALKSSKIEGKLTGGNLVTAEAGLGTAWQIDTKGKILFLEEIEERGYRIDRSLEHLKQAGALVGVKAIIFGDVLGGLEKDGKTQLCWQAIERFSLSQKIPVLKGLPSGHGPLQRPIPLNTPSILKTGAAAELVCETGIDLRKRK